MEDSIWELYGLRTNPFFTEPLLIFSGDVDLRLGFVGREEEIKRLKNVIYNNNRSRILIAGDVGVGKTTFVNYVRILASQDKFFTTLKEIAVQPEWNGVDFILNTLSAIYYTIKLRTDLDNSIINRDLFRKLELLVDIVENKDKNYSLNIGAIGGGLGTSTSVNVPSPNIHSLLLFFEQIISEIKKSSYKGVILHYNNLDTLESEQIVNLFHSIRDFMQSNDVHFIFIGNLIVPQIISQIKRVQSIMSDTPIIINNLSIKEVKQLLDIRIKQLASPFLTPIKPYDDEIVSRLYNLYDGNLRYILNSLSILFQEIVRDNPIVIGNREMTRVLSETAKKRWINKLTELENNVLFLILKEEEITNKNIAKILHKQKQNISKITNKLLDLCAIRVRRIEGKEKFFAVEHSIKWFLLENEVTQPVKKVNISSEIQKVLGEF
jgi:Cdc6-like AAA superfamily ATPase